ncbi:hypothetical protein CQW23_19727 [Capsicum baccatum]|uniref:GAG-pre-integrase domain-containing protein n=1 Tax=Capsicum baccatum TaxID=33114 RepID=A0A2G2W6K8_CAPBA|nr:hypothetical protein CQW23_19727 [Capsicum baccatum]
MTGDLTIFTSSNPSSVPVTITVANGTNLDIQSSGTLSLHLGHPHTQSLKSLFSSGDLVSEIDFKNNVIIDCESCALAKAHLLSFNKSIHHTTYPFKLIHSDVLGSYVTVLLTPLSSYFVDEQEPNVRVSLAAPPPEFPWLLLLLHLFRIQATDSKEWTLAMQTKLDALARNLIWDLVRHHRIKLWLGVNGSIL